MDSQVRKFVFTVTAVLFFALAWAQDARQLRRERIQASYMLALGRTPSEAEINYWQGRTDASSINDFVANHKNFIKQDAATRKAVIVQSYNDVLGRNPNQGEIDYWSKMNSTYTELCKTHVQWLAANPSEYEQVIKRSYNFVLRRQPDAAELKYWKSQGTYSYLMLVGCHEDWVKRGNNKAQQQTSAGINAKSSYVNMVRISPNILNEAKSAAGVIAAGGGNVIAAGGGNVIAAGGGNVIAAGGGNIIAAGGGN